MSKVKLPKTIKIGPHVYVVTERDTDWQAHNHVLGRIRYDELLIDIVTESEPTVILDTLIHEILHGIHYVYGVNDEDDEERTVTAVATGYTAVLVDNPELVKTINRILKQS